MTDRRRTIKTFLRDAQEIVNRNDPVGLILLGAPSDEYDCIVTEAARILNQRTPLLPGLKEFVEPHFGVPPSDDALAAMAGELERAWAAMDDGPAS